MAMSEDEFRRKFLNRLERIDKSLQHLSRVIENYNERNIMPGKNSKCNDCVFGSPLQSKCANCYEGEYFTPAYKMEDDLK